MTKAIRPYLAFALACLVALASVSHALARHQAHGATTMVICTSYGLVQITLDSDGNPVEQSPHCPDCMLSHAAHLPDTPVTACPAASSTIITTSQNTHHDPRAAGLWQQSRAPPFPV